MATLRKYSSFQTRRTNRLLTANKAILLIIGLLVGGGVFTTINALSPTGKPSVLAGMAVPVADKIARALQSRPKKFTTAARPIIIPPDANAARRNATFARLAAERRRAAKRVFSERHNVDRTPVASIGQRAPAFREIAPAASAPGFREITH